MVQRYASIMDAIHSAETLRKQALPIVQPADLAAVDVPTRQWCIPDWFPDKAVSLLTGDGGTGKSLLALQLATCMALGLPFLGIETAPRKVAYFSCEDDEDELHRRQADICKMLSCDMAELRDRLYWLPMVGTDAVLGQSDKNSRVTITDTYRNLRLWCKQIGIQLLIIDTAADTFAGLEIDRQQVTRFVRHLDAIARETGGAVILLAHPSVAGLRDRTGISGSTAWRNAVRSVVHLSRPEDDRDERAHLPDIRFLERLKGNYSAIGGRLSITYCSGHFVIDQDADALHPQMDQLTVEHKVLTAIKSALRTGKQPSPSTQSIDCAERMLLGMEQCKSLSRKNIGHAIKRMEDKGELRVAHIGTGKNSRKVLVPADWSALPDERDPLTGQRRGAAGGLS